MWNNSALSSGTSSASIPGIERAGAGSQVILTPRFRGEYRRADMGAATAAFPPVPQVTNEGESPMAKSPAEEGAKPAEQPQAPKVRWDTHGLKSTYANFCNATSTCADVVLNFGVNQNWDRMSGEVEIELDHRIILSPFAAKRLSDLLQKLMAEYENRYGELK
jgi:hypothetical protein